MFIAAVLIYAFLTLIPAPDQEALQRFDVSATTLRLLSLTVVVPMALIWFAAFYGYQTLHRYQKAVAESEDGQRLVMLTKGIFVLALSLPLTTIISSILNLYTRNRPHLEAEATIISNYIELFIPLLAFIYISKGARKLVETTKKRPSQYALNSIVFISMFLGVAYCYLSAVAPGSLYDSYFLTTGFFLFSIALPYMYMWFLGLFAAHELYLYSHKVKGTIYRQAWSTLSKGLATVIIVSIVLQYLTALSAQLEELSLGWLLALVYVLLLLWGASYLLVASGTKKLQMIEEV